MDWKNAFVSAGRYWQERNPRECWQSICSDERRSVPISTSSIASSSSKSPYISHWTEIQDKKLSKLAAKYGYNWEIIQEEFPEKSIQELESRWNNKLDPSIKKTSWTHEEDYKLRNLISRHRENWHLISMYLEGRPPAVVERRARELGISSENGKASNGKMDLDHEPEMTEEEKDKEIEALNTRLEEFRLMMEFTQTEIEELETNMYDDQSGLNE